MFLKLIFAQLALEEAVLRVVALEAGADLSKIYLITKFLLMTFIKLLLELKELEAPLQAYLVMTAEKHLFTRTIQKY